MAAPRTPVRQRFEDSGFSAIDSATPVEGLSLSQPSTISEVVARPVSCGRQESFGAPLPRAPPEHSVTLHNA